MHIDSVDGIDITSLPEGNRESLASSECLSNSPSEYLSHDTLDYFVLGRASELVQLVILEHALVHLDYLGHYVEQVEFADFLPFLGQSARLHIL